MGFGPSADPVLSSVTCHQPHWATWLPGVLRNPCRPFGTFLIRCLEVPGSFMMLVLDVDCTMEIPTTQATLRPTESQSWGLGARHWGLFVFKSSKGFQCAADLRAIG